MSLDFVVESFKAVCTAEECRTEYWCEVVEHERLDGAASEPVQASRDAMSLTSTTKRCEHNSLE